jgi:hypothetical protein
MKKRIIHGNITVPSNHKATIIPQPGERPLHFPASFISPQLAAIIILLTFVVTAVRANQINTSLLQPLAQRIAVIALVCNQSLWVLSRSATTFSRNADVIQRFLEQRDFRWGRRVQVVSQRNTFAVDHHHPLRSFAPFGLSDAFAPFFAGAKLPSANASDQSSCPRWSSSERNALQAFSHTSCSSQSLSLRQQVEALGYCFGRSAQGAPVLKTQRIPSNTLRLSAQGLPPFFDFLSFGNNGSIFSHCWSVNFHLSLAIEKTPFYDQIYISPTMAQV